MSTTMKASVINNFHFFTSWRRSASQETTEVILVERQQWEMFGPTHQRHGVVGPVSFAFRGFFLKTQGWVQKPLFGAQAECRRPHTRHRLLGLVFTQTLEWATFYKKCGPVSGGNSIDAELDDCDILMKITSQWIDKNVHGRSMLRRLSGNVYFSDVCLACNIMDISKLSSSHFSSTSLIQTISKRAANRKLSSWISHQLKMIRLCACSKQENKCLNRRGASTPLWRVEACSPPSKRPNPIPAIPLHVVRTPHLHGAPTAEETSTVKHWY